MKKVFLLMLFGLLTLGGGCCKEELPGGYDYKFSCKINGVLWEAKYREHEGAFSRNDLDVSVFKLQDTAVMQIIATNVGNGEILSFGCLFADTIRQTQNYSFSSVIQSRTRCGSNYDMKRDEAVNRIEFTSRDTNMRIVKGTFKFQILARTSQCVDTLRITDGVFDVKY